jgi:hypothetical protein
MNHTIGDYFFVLVVIIILGTMLDMIKAVHRRRKKRMTPDLPEGTPQTLDEALAMVICLRPPDIKLEDHAYFTIKDYLSQKFGAVILKAKTEEEQKVLMDLFEKLVQRV